MIRKLFIFVVLFVQSLPSSATTVVEQEPSYNTGLVRQVVEDIRVKIMGGKLSWHRHFDNGYWSFNPNWNNISYGQVKIIDNSAGVVAKARSGYGSISESSSNYKEDKTVIIRNGYHYKQEKSNKNNIYRYDNEKYIEKTVNGFTWRNRLGDWIKYDQNGVIESFGNATGIIAIFVHNSDNKIEIVKDRFNNTILTINYLDGKPKSVEDYSGRKVTYHWEGNLLKKIVDINSNDWGYTYDSYESQSEDLVAHAISSFTDAENRVWKFSNVKVGGGVANICTGISSGGKIRETVDPDTGQISLTEEFPPGVENCKNTIIPDQVVTESIDDGSDKKHYFSYAYNNEQKAYHRTEIDPGGIKTQTYFGHDGSVNRVVRGDKVVISRIRVGDTLSIMDADGNVTEIKYDEHNNPTRITHPDDTYLAADYHPSYNYINRLVDENGVITEVEYNSDGLATKMVKAKGRSEQFTVNYTYNENNLVHFVVYSADSDTNSLKYEFDYDGYGNVTQEIVNDDIIWQYKDFTPTGQPKHIIDGRGKSWRYEYDLHGRLIKETNPNDISKSYVYDKVGNLKQYNSGEENNYSFEYNINNQLTKVINPDKTFVQYKYKSGVNVSTVNEEGHAKSTYLDRAGRPHSTIDANNNKTSYQMGKSDELSSGAFDHLNRIDYPTYSQLYKYNNRSRVNQMTLLMDEQSATFNFRYDPVGNIISKSDANGHSTIYKYDGLGYLTESSQSGKVISYQYSSFGNLVSYSDRNNYITFFEYDNFGRVTKKSRAEYGDWNFSYDKNDNLRRIVDGNNQRIDFIYDDINQLIEEHWYASEGDLEPYHKVLFSYDKDSNLVGWTSGEQSGALIRDKNGRLRSEKINFGPFSKTYHYQYYPDGMTKSLLMPDGTAYNYEYDDNNQLNRLSIPEKGSLTVNKFNWRAPAEETLPGGISRVTEYTGLLSPKEIKVTTPDQQAVMNLSFAYGLVHELLQRKDIQQNIEYQYDDIYRLEQVTTTLPDGSQRLESYQLDANSNRIATHDESTWEYNSAGQLIHRGETSYSYDLQGNQTQRIRPGSKLHFTYDVKDRLIQVDDGKGTVVARYRYDPFDRRISKTVNGITTYYLYSYEGLIAEYDQNGREIRSYGYRPDSVWGRNLVFIRTRDLGRQDYYYYHNDHLGTPYLLTDSSGYVVWKANFDSFGNALLSNNNRIENNVRYPGQYFDAETGLHYNWRRYYDPETGRYITPDPIDLNGGANLYTYVDGDPINRIDPNGECGLWGIGAGILKSLLKAWITGDCFSYSMWDAFKDGFCASMLPGKWGKGAKWILDKWGEFENFMTIWESFNSFSGDTLVHTEHGLRPIANIKVGDYVLSYAEWSAEESYQEVEEVIVNNKTYELVVLTLESGEVIEVTDGHPLYVLGSGWVEAKDLRIGEQLYQGDEGAISIKSIHSKKLETTVYNLNVANTNTYFVGEAKLLVHNVDSEPVEMAPSNYALSPDKSSMVLESGLNKHIRKINPNAIKKPNTPTYFTVPLITDIQSGMQ